MPPNRIPRLPPAVDRDPADGAIDAAADESREDDEPTASADLTNGVLARIFHEIGDMLEVKGELVYKTVAYHRAADAIAHTAEDVAEGYRRGDPPKIAGVGAAIGEKIRELVTTGHMAFYERLRAEVPPALVELLRVPGVGPEDRPRPLRDARHRESRGPAPRRRGRHCCGTCAACRRSRSSRSLPGSSSSSPTRAGCCWDRRRRSSIR